MVCENPFDDTKRSVTQKEGTKYSRRAFSIVYLVENN